MADTVIRIDSVWKKFCRSLNRSMLYGMADVCSGLFGRSSGDLRKGEFWAVRDVSCELGRGQTLGLIGPNGSGKTTLLKIIGGILPPDRGRVYARGRVGSLIAAGVGFHPLLTGRENIYLSAAVMGMGRPETRKRFDEIVAFADIGDFLDSPVKHYSSGMAMRLGFSVCVHCDPEILLIDEVLAVGDVKFQAKCFNKLGNLRSKGTSTLLVSHSTMHILGFSDQVLYLKGGMPRYSGDPQAAIKLYQEDMFSGVDFRKKGPPAEDRGFTVTSSEWMSPDGKIVERLIAGNEVLLRLHYEAKEHIGPVEVDIALSGPGNELLFRASSKSFRKEIIVSSGEGHVDIIIRKLNLNNQSICAHVAFWKYDRSQLIGWEKDIPLFVSGDARCGGKMVCDVDWRDR